MMGSIDRFKEFMHTIYDVEMNQVRFVFHADGAEHVLEDTAVSSDTHTDTHTRKLPAL